VRTPESALLFVVSCATTAGSDSPVFGLTAVAFDPDCTLWIAAADDSLLLGFGPEALVGVDEQAATVRIELVGGSLRAPGERRGTGRNGADFFWSTMSTDTPHVRLARPVSDLRRSEEMYRRGLGLTVLGHFEGHAGFDGVMLGVPGAPYHIELTRSRLHEVRPSPTPEDLVVVYLPEESAWRSACARMSEAGFVDVEPWNPYWAERGRTFMDTDGYRVVLERADWRLEV